MIGLLPPSTEVIPSVLIAMESEREKEEIKPPDPPDKEQIRKLVCDIVGDLDSRIRMEVEDQLKTYQQIIDERDRRIFELECMMKQLENDVKILSNKQPQFSKVLEIRNRMESKAPEPVRTPLNTSFPRVAETAAAFLPSGASQQAVRRPSVNARRPPGGPQPPKQVMAATEKEVRDQFKSSKSKIVCKPVTLKHVICMYQQITSDIANYTPDEILHGEKHAQARLECANQFMELELNWLPGQFKVIRADYNRDHDKCALIVTLGGPDQVRKCFFKQAKLQNRRVEVQTHFPQVTRQRRGTLFEWVKEARKKFPHKNFQVRLGEKDLEIFEKEREGYGNYTPLPLAAFAEELGVDFDSLPGMFKERETAIGRPETTEPKKNNNSSPIHQEQREAKISKTNDNDEEGENETSPDATVNSDTPVSPSDRVSQAREKNDSQASQDGAF